MLIPFPQSQAIQATPQDEVLFTKGQSNSRGANHALPDPSPYRKQFARVFIWSITNQQWENLEYGVNHQTLGDTSDGTPHGAELGYAQEWEDNHPEGNLYIVKYAVSGTALAEPTADTPLTSSYWRATDGNLFQGFMAEAKAALSQLTEPYIVRGFYWNQGNADTSPANFDIDENYLNLGLFSYAENLRNLIVECRNNIPNAKNAPWVVTTLKEESPVGLVDPLIAFNKMLSRFVNDTDLEGVSLYDCSHLTLTEDVIHWDSDSQNQAGIDVYNLLAA